MKNYHRLLYGYCNLLFFGVFFLFPAVVFCQIKPMPPIPIINTNGNVVLKTTLSNAIRNPYVFDYETSVGLFYRLEYQNNNQKLSYFWPASIHANDDPAKEIEQDTFDLPNGKYDLTVYQIRKGGPIKTAIKNFEINNTLDTNSFPSIHLGNSSLGLFSSWNISSKGFTLDLNDNPDHGTYISSKIPDENVPWVIMSLVKNGVQPQQINLDYPDCLDYGGAIYENCMIYGSGACNNVIMSPLSQSSISIKNNNAGSNNPFIIHLLFTKNEKLPNPDTVQFYVKYLPYSITTNFEPVETTFTFDVHPLPHDPNCLAVDKKELCEYGADEYLTYRIDYQNDGEKPTDTVTVTLSNTSHLVESTIQHEQYTRSWNIPINPTGTTKSGPNQFVIVYPNGLPGLKQNSTLYPKVTIDACSDYFDIKVKKEDWLSAGTVIQPIAQIHFAQTNETIYTNLDETKIVNQINCKACPPNPACPRCPQKKRCWLRDLFIRKRE